MTRNTSVLSAGLAFDKLRAIRESNRRRARELFDAEIAKLPHQEAAIRARVPPDELALLDSMLAAIAPKQEVTEAQSDTTESSEPIRLVGKPRGT